MTTHVAASWSQWVRGDLPRDTEVIRTILRCNEGRAGVALRTQDSGVVRRGEKVEVL